jgi:uncharacterized protein
MAQDIWINLPVIDLARSITFFTEIGFAHNPGLGNSEKSASFTIGEKKVVLMLFLQDGFSSFTSNVLSDTKQIALVNNNFTSIAVPSRMWCE